MTDRRIGEDELARQLAGLGRWRRDGDRLVRELELDNFGAVIAAVNRIAKLAEEHNHHPDMLIHGWNGLTVWLSTHSAGGLTAKDLALATKIDALV